MIRHIKLGFSRLYFCIQTPSSARTQSRPSILSDNIRFYLLSLEQLSIFYQNRASIPFSRWKKQVSFPFVLFAYSNRISRIADNMKVCLQAVTKLPKKKVSTLRYQPSVSPFRHANTPAVCGHGRWEFKNHSCKADHHGLIITALRILSNVSWIYTEATAKETFSLRTCMHGCWKMRFPWDLGSLMDQALGRSFASILQGFFRREQCFAWQVLTVTDSLVTLLIRTYFLINL